jgi:tetrapyrrole methylase family protein/MazG family protein
MADPPTTKTAGSRFPEFVSLIARLRAPGGCPWDREQTHRSLKPMTIEEAYEVLEAIDDGDDGALADELGDLLLQVVFHSAIAAEEGRFSIDARADTPGEVLRNWEALKAEERRAAGKDAPEASSLMDGVSARLPAVMEAFQMTTKAGRVGFDWERPEDVLAKLDEEAGEVRGAVSASPRDARAVEDEVGDLLFAAVNVARALGADPESALKAANRKFRRRFRYVEDRLRERGKAPADASLAEMDALWNEAKAREAGAS